MALKQVRGFWLPETEDHLVHFLEGSPEFAGGPTYQLHKLMLCMKHIKNFSHALDIGAHCGLWSRVMAQMFTRVTAFEPVSLHRSAFERNVLQYNVKLWPVALGASEGKVSLHTGQSSSGDTYVQAGGEHEAQMYTLDSFEELPKIDFIKIDCEGYEKFICQGGEKRIRRDQPVMIIEQKPNKGRQFGIGDRDALTLVESWGAFKVEEYAGDFVMAWR